MPLRRTILFIAKILLKVKRRKEAIALINYWWKKLVWYKIENGQWIKFKHDLIEGLEEINNA
jgi:hypothetical protein